MARKGSFGTSLTPFGEPDTDLSVYQIGTPAPATPLPQPIAPPIQTTSWYTAAEPPVKPTVAPEPGVQPQPVIPAPVVPAVNYAQAAITMQGYVDTLRAVANPTPAQQTALTVDLAQLAYNQAQISPAVAAAAANVATMQKYVNALSAVANPTTAQKAALTVDLAQLAKNQATLASLTGG